MKKGAKKSKKVESDETESSQEESSENEESTEDSDSVEEEDSEESSEEEVKKPKKKETKKSQPNEKAKTTTTSSEAKTERTILREGNLYLVVSEARALAKKNLLGAKSDPYSEIHIMDTEYGEKKKEKKKDLENNRVYRSKVLKKNLDPHWNEGSKIFPIEEKDKCVRVMLWNCNRIRSDDFMGEVVFRVPEINDGVPYEDWYPLQSREGKKDKVKGEIHLQLLFLDPDEKITGEEFKWPIHTFLRKRRIDIIETLLRKKKADKNFSVEKKDSADLCPLHVACDVNLPQGVAILIENGADVNAIGGEHKRTPLHHACTSSPEAAKILIDAKAKITAEDDDGNSPLHIAAQNDQPTTIQLLLKKGVDIDKKNKHGNTALHMAITGRAFQALKALVDNGADIYMRNKNKKTSGECAADMDEESKNIFMEAVGVEDYAEIALLEKWKERTRVEEVGLNYDWRKSPQFVIVGKIGVEVQILVHHVKQPDNTQLSYCVAGADNDKYKQPSLTEIIGYGASEPFSATLGSDEKLPHLVVVPYAKSKDTPDKITLLVFTKPGHKVKVKSLQEYSHESTIKGEWKGKQAGGAQSEENEKTWHKNPFFSLSIPKKKVDVAICLAQKQSALDAASLIPYQIIPYPFYIGFYLYDQEVETLVGQCRKWKNAKEVFKTFTLDGTVEQQYTIVPTTFKAKEETTFMINVYSSAPIKLKKFED